MQVRMIPILLLCTQFRRLITHIWRRSENIEIVFFPFYLIVFTIRLWKKIFLADSISLTVCKPSLHRTLYSFTTSSWKWIGLQRRMKLHWNAVMTLHFLVSLCFWQRIMRNVTFFTLFDFCSVLQTTNEISLIVSVAWFTEHSIIQEKRKVRRFMLNMPNEMHLAKCALLCNCILIVFNSVITWTINSTIRDFAGKMVAGGVYFYYYVGRELFYFIAYSKYHSFVTHYRGIFFAPKRCRRIWFISSRYNRQNFHALR